MPEECGEKERTVKASIFPMVVLKAVIIACENISNLKHIDTLKQIYTQ